MMEIETYQFNNQTSYLLVLGALAGAWWAGCGSPFAVDGTNPNPFDVSEYNHNDAIERHEDAFELGKYLLNTPNNFKKVA